MWRLVFTLTGALDERRPCPVVNPMDVDLSEVFEEPELNLGDLGGDTPAHETREEEEGDESGLEREQAESRQPRKKPRKDVSAKNMALRIIVRKSLLSMT